MKKVLIVCGLVLGCASGALAGDASAGKGKTLVCSACHGADGNSAAATFPKLAGQNEKYLVKQMMDIKSGARPVPTMAGQLDNMSDEDLADIAAWYASQTNSGGQADAELVPLGQKVYRAGVSARGVAACTACHGPRGNGNAPAGFPALAGQHADYIADQLRRFRIGSENTLAENAGGRTNDGDSAMMRDVAAGMSDNQITAVSSYIAGLH
jgi:cytochrome c553